jgi:hypothetical protein
MIFYLLATFLLFKFHVKSKLTVHLIAHSHDDVGWVWSPYEYYYGNSKDNKIPKVRLIYNSILDELLKDETKKFVICEIAFFRWWWNE